MDTLPREFWTKRPLPEVGFNKLIGGVVVKVVDDWVVAVVPMIYNDRIVLSHASRWDTEIVAGWCYTPRGSGAAYLAAVLWDPRETDRPKGFVKEAFDAR